MNNKVDYKELEKVLFYERPNIGEVHVDNKAGTYYLTDTQDIFCTFKEKSPLARMILRNIGDLPKDGERFEYEVGLPPDNHLWRDSESLREPYEDLTTYAESYGCNVLMKWEPTDNHPYKAKFTNYIYRNEKNKLNAYYQDKSGKQFAVNYRMIDIVPFVSEVEWVRQKKLMYFEDEDVTIALRVIWIQIENHIKFDPLWEDDWE